MANELILTQKKFTDKVYTMTFKDDDGVAINITGATVYVTVKTQPDLSSDDSTAIIRKEITSHTTPLSGITQFTFTKEDVNVAPKDYMLDIKLYMNGSLSSIDYIGKLKIVSTAQNSLY